MKKVFLSIALVLTLTASALAAEDVSPSDVQADPTKFIGHSITLSGTFLRNDPARDSFFINQNGTVVEVLLKNLSPNGKEYILSQQPSAKTEITVTGVIQVYSNKRNVFYIIATSLLNVDSQPQPTGTTQPQPSVTTQLPTNGTNQPQTIARIIPASPDDIASDPADYVGKTVIMTGMFTYSEPMRESILLNHNGAQFEIFVRDVAKAKRDYLYSLDQGAKVEITATGTIHEYTNKEKSYFMDATSVTWE